MERRLTKLEIVYRRAEQDRSIDRDVPVDWRQAPWLAPECFAAMTEAEKVEWGALMTEYSAPGAWQDQKPRGYYARLAELDNKIDMRAYETPLCSVR